MSFFGFLNFITEEFFSKKHFFSGNKKNFREKLPKFAWSRKKLNDCMSLFLRNSMEFYCIKSYEISDKWTYPGKKCRKIFRQSFCSHFTIWLRCSKFPSFPQFFIHFVQITKILSTSAHFEIESNRPHSLIKPSHDYCLYWLFCICDFWFDLTGAHCFFYYFIRNSIRLERKYKMHLRL